jgi:hypothetical protein
MKKVLIILLVITLYCNIGWTVGSYYANHVITIPKAQLTNLGKVAAGGWSWTAKDEGWLSTENIATFIVIFFGVFWPVGLAINVIIWVVYFVYYAIWFMVWGGGVKLLSLA